MADDEHADVEVLARGAGAALTTEPTLPVVARLVIEIHSDGSRTIARGALATTDASPGGATSVAIEARGATPLALAMELTKSLAATLAPLALRRQLTPRPRPPSTPRRSLRSRVRGLLDRK